MGGHSDTSLLLIVALAAFIVAPAAAVFFLRAKPTFAWTMVVVALAAGALFFLASGMPLWQLVPLVGIVLGSAAFFLRRGKAAPTPTAQVAPAATVPTIATVVPPPRPTVAEVPPTAPPAAAAPKAAHDVFISYSTKDKLTADALCAVLEQNGVRCWIAPRDVYPGEDWAGAIIRAISGARLFVLVFSSFANESSQIKREVERAANHEVPIIPFRIQDIPANESLEYFISAQHWLDAFTPPLQDHAERLVATTKRLLGARA